MLYEKKKNTLYLIRTLNNVDIFIKNWSREYSNKIMFLNNLVWYFKNLRLEHVYVLTCFTINFYGNKFRSINKNHSKLEGNNQVHMNVNNIRLSNPDQIYPSCSCIKSTTDNKTVVRNTNLSGSGFKLTIF